MTRRILLVWRVLAFLAAVTAVSPPAWAQGTGASEGLTESLLRVKLARGVDLNLLVSQRSGTQPSIAALLFAGYPGILKLREEEGKVVTEMGGNFLIRARRFLNTEQVFTVAVDCPADQQNACGDPYRSSAQHVADIAEVAAAIKQNYAARERVVMAALHDWVTARKLPAVVGAAD